jgi:hypothetical protein
MAVAIDIRKDRECWLWQGAVNDGGYGVSAHPWANGRTRTQLVHRRVYEVFHGVKLGRLHIHHTCGVKLCVNPAHLVALTQGDHNRLHFMREYCVRGHLLSETRCRPTAGGTTACRACIRIRDRINHRKRRDRALGLVP